MTPQLINVEKNMPPHTYPPPEPLLAIKEAAAQLGLPYWKLNRAVRQSLIPSYTLLNSRRYVRVSEVLSHISGHGTDTDRAQEFTCSPSASEA
jgi:hypothetical protein